MTTNAYVYRTYPDDFPSLYPAVILLHGSSKVRSDRKMWKGISFHSREGSEELTER